MDSYLEIEALISDFDGTLFDTSEVNLSSYQKAFQLDNLLFGADELKFLGEMRIDQFLERFAPHFPKDHIPALRERKNEFFAKSLADIRINFPLLSFLMRAKSRLKVALVTNASRFSVLSVLKHFDLAELFELKVFGDDVDNPKPSPEGFLKCLSELQINSLNTLCFEDSETGLLAARRAGLKVIKLDVKNHEDNALILAELSNALNI